MTIVTIHGRPKRRRIRLALPLIFFLIGWVPAERAHAQSATATLFGSVVDQTGAPLADVRIRITKEETGIRRIATSGPGGHFVFPLMTPGAYSAVAALPGFRTEIVKGIWLSVGDMATLEFELKVGGIQEEITVVAERILVEVETAARGSVVGEEEMSSLPLNRRQYLELSLLGPGVAPPAAGSRLSVQANSGVNVSGAREASNNFLLDGVDNNDLFINRMVVNPSVDAIREFRIHSANYDAEYGRSGGAQVNVVTKSGTNRFHGSLYEFLRNSRLDARNFFDPVEEKIPQFQRNQFGGTLGGPLVKARTFFFLNFEGVRTRRAESRLANVPTLLEKGGDFSESGVTILDPFTGLPFSGNRIPEDRIHPVGRNLAALYPDPNRSVAGGNFLASPVGRERSTQFNLRLDHEFSSRNHFFSRYSAIDGFDFYPFAPKGVNVPGFGINTLDKGQNLVIGDTHVIGPGVLNDFRFGFNRLRREVFPQNQGRDVLGSLGITGLEVPPRDQGFPSLVLAGYEQLGDDPNLPLARTTGTYHFTESMSLHQGAHFLKAGVEVRHYRQDGFNDLFGRGQLHFQPVFSGDALADLLLGFPTLSIAAVNDNPQALRTTAYNVFFQDHWKIHSRLSLSAGLRYEFNTSPVDTDDRLLVFDVATRQLKPVGQDGVPRAGFDSDRNNFAPRIGFSWDPDGRGKMVVRSAYGIFYDSGTLVENSALYFNPPFFQLNLFFPSAEGLLTLDDPFPSAQAFSPAPSPITLGRDFRTAYAQQWSFGVQREIAKDVLFEVDYVGSRGTALVMKRNLNQPLPGPGDLGPRRPFAGFSDILIVESAASSIYHSLQARVRKHYSGRLYFSAAYTFSKVIDNASAFLESQGDGNTPQNSRNTRAERSLANFDLRHRLAVSLVYDLPFGPRRRWLGGANGFSPGLVRNWQVSSILTARSGQPFTPRLTIDNSNTGNVGGFFAHDRPNRVSDARLANPTPDQFFNVDAFEIPDPFNFGNSGRNILRGPTLRTLDLALVRNIRIREETKLQFRMEFFNLLNRTNFDLPEGFVDRPTFGKIISAGPARQIQFALKLLF